MKKFIITLLTVSCFSMVNAQKWRPLLYAAVNSMRNIDAHMESIRTRADQTIANLSRHYESAFFHHVAAADTVPAMVLQASRHTAPVVPARRIDLPQALQSLLGRADGWFAVIVGRL